MPSFSDHLKSIIQYPLPHHLLSKGMYWATRIQHPGIKNLMINQVVQRFNVDMSIAAEPNPEAYASFNHFFTRTLRDGVRPIAAETNAVACPVDGAVSEAGRIIDGRVYQAKGHDYSLQALVGGNEALRDLFIDGSFATIYLSPRDYHRIHMPLAGELRHMVYVPGRLFSVNAATTRTVPGLFARNERLVAIFDTQWGPMAVILVGAIFVGGIETVWTGNYGDATFRDFEYRQYGPQHARQVKLDKGEEMGRFNMGSTVVLLFGKDMLDWSNKLTADATVVMGEQIGVLNA